MPLETTVGQLLINDALPEDLRDYGRTLDKKGIQKLLRDVAQQHPDDYRQIAQRLSEVGWRTSQRSGGYSFGLSHIRKSKYAQQLNQQLQQSLQAVLDNDNLDDKQREELVVKLVGARLKEQQDKVYAESESEKSPLAMQVRSGSKGNAMNLSSLRGSDLLYADHRNHIVPIPVLRSYSEGLRPEEYWAGSYGARKGVTDLKFATMEAGFLCLSGGTLVRMGDFSVKPIEQIRVGDVVLGANRQGETFPVYVTNTFENGVRDLYRFRFRYGRSRTKTVEIIATEEHKALLRHIRRNRCRPDPVLHKTVTTDIAPLGVCENRTVSAWSLLPAQGFTSTTYGYKFDYAWLVGLLIGDGGLTTRHISFSCGENGLLELVQEELTTFGFTLKRKKNSKYEYVIKDYGPGKPNRLKTALRSLGLLGSLAHEKVMPDAVASWDNASVAALIRGIFDTDGGVATSKNDAMPFVRLGMTSSSIVYGVQQLLADRFGIYGQVSKSNSVGRKCYAIPGRVYLAKNDCYALTIADRKSIERFAALVNFASPAKRNRLTTLLQAATNVDNSEREDGFVFHYLDREYVGAGSTYDIEVDHADHLFVLANGAIVSNSKQLNQVAHRLVIAGLDKEDDGEEPDRTIRGLPVDLDDNDNEGSLLAHDVGPYKRNTVLTPKIIKHLSQLGKKRILVRSPMIGGSPDGGVYARDVGVREHGTLPGIGENPGLAAVQALSEPLTQSQISSKHTGGVAGEGKAISGFDYINSLVQVPKQLKGGATHSELDGVVTNILDAPAGGKHVYVNGEEHYVPADIDTTVKVGDRVEAGDTLSDGIPNPAHIVRHKGVGEGRRYFVSAFRKAMQNAGMSANRRNIELLSRGLINHVRLTDEYGNYAPDDVLPYSTLEHVYQPREDAQTVKPSMAAGKYLEKPVLHYTIGTPLRPSVIKDLDEFGVNAVTVHHQPPPFQPEMIRGMQSLGSDPDWMTRFYGSGLKGSLLKGVHRGAVSDEAGSSFVPSLARAVDFGRGSGIVQKPQPGYKVDFNTGQVKAGQVSGVPGDGKDLNFGSGQPAGVKPLPTPTPTPKPTPIRDTSAEWQSPSNNTVNGSAWGLRGNYGFKQNPFTNMMLQNASAMGPFGGMFAASMLAPDAFSALTRGPGNQQQAPQSGQTEQFTTAPAAPATPTQPPIKTTASVGKHMVGPGQTPVERLTSMGTEIAGHAMHAMNAKNYWNRGRQMMSMGGIKPVTGVLGTGGAMADKMFSSPMTIPLSMLTEALMYHNNGGSTAAADNLLNMQKPNGPSAFEGIPLLGWAANMYNKGEDVVNRTPLKLLMNPATTIIGTQAIKLHDPNLPANRIRSDMMGQATGDAAMEKRISEHPESLGLSPIDKWTLQEGYRNQDPTKAFSQQSAAQRVRLRDPGRYDKLQKTLSRMQREQPNKLWDIDWTAVNNGQYGTVVSLGERSAPPQFTPTFDPYTADAKP